MSDSESDNLNNLVTNLNFEVATTKSDAMDMDVEVQFDEPEIWGSRKSARLKSNREDDRLTDTEDSGNETPGVKFEASRSLNPVGSIIKDTSRQPSFKVDHKNMKGENQMIVRSSSMDDDDVEVDEKKYGVYMVPDDESEYKLICRKPIRSGATICVNDRCRVKAHRTLKKVSFAKGQIYVMKNKGAVFANPSIPSYQIDPEIVDAWEAEPQPLTHWTTQFRMAASNLSKTGDGFVTKEGLAREGNFTKTTKRFQTPKRERFKENLELKPLKKYQRLFDSDTSYEVEQLPSYLDDIDENIDVLFAEVLKARKVQAFLGNLFEQTTNKVELKLEDISALIGKKPIQLESEFDTPDLWATVGEVAARTKEKDGGSNVDIQKVMEQTNNLMDDKLKYIGDPKSKEIKYIRTLVSSLATNTNVAFTKVSEEFAKVRSSFAQASHPSHHAATDMVDLRSEMNSIISRLTKVEQESVRARIGEGDSVLFHNLGFKSKREADAWLIINAPKQEFGYLVDFHTVMEHINQQITGMDSLSSLGKLYKLKLRTISEGVAITSFENNNPRFLTSSGAHAVVDSESSYFTHIPTYLKWNDPLEGFKKRWKSELNIFRTSHLEFLQSHLASTSPMYQLAITSLTESVSWVLGFINYIDETYIQYASGKFGTKKSWHITTKLATALITDIALPRRGALNSFEAGEGQQINGAIFYAVLRSLDKMTQIVAQNYKDAPVVSTELVKFLSMNTSVEAVDKLIEQSATFKTSMEEMQRKLGTVVKDCGTVGNKVDSGKNELTAIKARILKLENKK